MFQSIYQHTFFYNAYLLYIKKYPKKILIAKHPSEHDGDPKLYGEKTFILSTYF